MSSVEGFGDFDPHGIAPARSWQEVLEGTVEVAHRELTRTEAGSLPDSRPVITTYMQLLPRCPNDERGLIHGDFGANNVLATNGRISAVLDWDLAMAGDPLYDVANVYFWASYLPCMQVQASFVERTPSHLDAYEDRVRCYALRIGLEEACENVRDGDLQMGRWALARCHHLLSERL